MNPGDDKRTELAGTKTAGLLLQRNQSQTYYLIGSSGGFLIEDDAIG